MDVWLKWDHISWWALWCAHSNNEAWEELVLWDHWVFFTLCVLHFFSSLIWNLSYQAFFNSKWWRIMGLKWFVCVFMFSQLILWMCEWRNCDVFLLLWKEMKVWDYFLLFVLPPRPFTSFLLYKLECSPEQCWASNQNIFPSVVSHLLQKIFVLDPQQNP